jgi:hypothetical protein
MVDAAFKLLRQLLVTTAVVAGLALLTGCSPTSIRRPGAYNSAALAAIQNFKSATIVPQTPGKSEWDAKLTFGVPPIIARVVGGQHISASMIHVTYSDAAEEHQVFEPRDYTNNIEIRVKDSTLYVYRAITLLWTEYRLAAFDMARRRRIGDYLVSPDDMTSSQP